MMPWLFSLLCLALLAQVTPAPQRKHLEGRTDGELNDGRWYCPWYLDWGECADGEFTCTCPGDGTAARFTIGCCYHFPECGRICHNHDCSRYSHCATCRGKVGELEDASCLSCIPGFKLGIGDCKEDVDECAIANGGCDQVCHNTYGSYHCSCHDGFRLAEDKHQCQRLSCGEPPSLAGGKVEASGAWFYDSYAKYSCSDPRHALVGNQIRRCDGVNDTVFWDGQQPECIDTCSIGTEKPASCGPPSVSQDTCIQLGCCFDEKLATCSVKPGDTYLEFSGVRPGEGDGTVKYERSTVPGCAYRCDSSEGATCRSFGIRTLGTNEDHDVTYADCNLLPKAWSEYVAAGEIVDDPNYDFYSPLNAQHKMDASFDDEQSVMIEKVYQGCYEDSTTSRDLPHQAFTEVSTMSPSSCIHTCRSLGYLFAGIQDGVTCFCGNEEKRKYPESEQCTKSCVGHPCGGDLTNSVYRVAYDDRYLGCYGDKESDRDLPVMAWLGGGQSATDCLEQCRTLGHPYAGVQDGGTCFCGDSFGKHGGVDETSCNVTCAAGFGHENCGGLTHNAIYRTEKPYDMSSHIDPTAAQIYDGTGKITSIPMSLFTSYPGVHNIVTNKLIVYSSELIETPIEDPDCSSDCYQACGNIENEEGLDKGQVVVLRFFYIHLSDLHKYVGASAQRVYVYAQTVVIDGNLVFPHALLIRTRQLIVNRDTTQYLSVDSEENLDEVDFEHATLYGPYANQLHQQQSFMCARILIDEKVAANENTAFEILRDISHTKTNSDEHHAFVSQVRTFIGEMVGINRNSIHYVPIYSKTQLAKILENYYEKISLYKHDYDRLVDSTSSNEDFLRYAESMHKIFTEADVLEAESSLQQTVQAVHISNVTYQRLRENYDDARQNLEEARTEFEKGIDDSELLIQFGLRSFVTGIVRVVYGLVKTDWAQIGQGIGEIINGTETEVTDPMEALAATVAQIDLMARQADELLKHIEDREQSFDYEQYADDVEIMIALQVNIIQWSNLKQHSMVFLTAPDVIGVSGSQGYALALMEQANWGEALTKSMVERAELLRQAMEKRAIVDMRIEKMERVDQVIKDMNEDVTNRERLLAVMTEQTYDVRMDLNEALLMFCRAYFYENLEECKDTYKPSFGGSFSELLLRINLALRDDIFTGNPPSTVSRFVSFVDSDLDPACRDVSVCPVNYLRTEKVLMLTIPTDHPDLQDLDKYRVAEIVIEVEGAKPTGSNNYLKFGVESNGMFQGRVAQTVYQFLTKPINLLFEYDVTNGYISIHADMYGSFNEIIHHVTPYTTWVLPVDLQRSGDIDLTDVTNVRLRLDGSAIPARNTPVLFEQKIDVGDQTNETEAETTLAPTPEPEYDPSFNEQKYGMLSKLYAGCYEDNANQPDLSHLAATDETKMTAFSCQSICRDLGYKLAGLQAGIHCYCGSNDKRSYNASRGCTEACPGDIAQLCGGHNANSIYHVDPDMRYLGCYADLEDGPDMSYKLWESTSGHSAHACITQCMLGGYRYAGVQDGGSCFCDNRFGQYGGAEESTCNATCDGYSHQNCGGHLANAVYRTENPQDLGASVPKASGNLYDGSGMLTGVPTTLFTIFPGVRNLVTNKLVIHSHLLIKTPQEAGACSGDCYTSCGNIYNEADMDRGDHVVLRFFFFKLSDLAQYVGDNPKQVLLFAQTVLIDSNIEVSYSLLIRARQIVLDRQHAFTLSVSHDAPDLDLDLDHVIKHGPFGDLFHQELSYMCARILLEEKDSGKENLAWSILREIAASGGETREQRAFIGTTRTYIGELMGISRADINFVPLYTKSHLTEILDVYYDRISLYKEDYDRLSDSTTSNEAFLTYAENMHNIYAETDVKEANEAFENTIDNIHTANITYARLRNEYDRARDELEVARKVFEEGIYGPEEPPEPVKQGILGYLEGVVNVIFGYINGDWLRIMEGLAQMRNNTAEIIDPMEQLAEVIYQIDQLADEADGLLRHLEDLHQEFDYDKYMADVELMVSMQVNVVQWSLLRDQSAIILALPEVAAIPGAAQYTLAVMNQVSWGEALTRAMVERAEMLRLAMQQRFTLETKQEKMLRIQQAIDNMKEDVSERQVLLTAMTQQSYDVRIDLNDLLIMFCRAYFYEKLETCPQAYKPAFGGSFSDLLFKINAAKRDELLTGAPPSSVGRILTIKDTDLNPACMDPTSCPINYLRHKRVLMVTVPTNHPELSDLNRYRVVEVVLDVAGARPSATNSNLKLFVQSNGNFQSRDPNNKNIIHNFLTKPVNLAFDYDITTGHITVHADMHDQFGNIVQHVTPYTTWYMPVDDFRSGDIDLNDVTSVSMRLEGYFYVSRSKAEEKTSHKNKTNQVSGKHSKI